MNAATSTLRCVFALCLFVVCAAAQQPTPLRVATKVSAPFSFRDKSGVWVGMSIDLLREVARRAELGIELTEVKTPEEIVDGVAAGRFDLGVAALSVTSAREERIDFSHPYFETGLGVALRGGDGLGIAQVARGLLSWPFVTLVGSIVAALLVSGWLFWLVERRRNPQFRDGGKQGVSTGLWWSTIMLLGHKGIFPTSVVGRLLAATSMVTSILMLSVLTGAIASALTVGHFESVVRDHHDLRHVRTFAVSGTTGEAFLRRERIAYESVPNVRTGLQLVADGRADALVHDAPLLEYEVARGAAEGLQVLPYRFELQDYAIALPQGSPLRERINKVLLEVKAGPEWEGIRYRYLQR